MVEVWLERCPPPPARAQASGGGPAAQAPNGARRLRRKLTEGRAAGVVTAAEAAVFEAKGWLWARKLQDPFPPCDHLVTRAELCIT